VLVTENMNGAHATVSPGVVSRGLRLEKHRVRYPLRLIGRPPLYPADQVAPSKRAINALDTGTPSGLHLGAEFGDTVPVIWALKVVTTV